MPPGGAIEEGSLLKAVMDDVCEKGARTCRTGAMLSWYMYARVTTYVCASVHETLALVTV